MTVCYPPSTAPRRALDLARADLIATMVSSGIWPGANVETPIKLLRALFGPRWASRDIIDMDDVMIAEGTDFLHRVTLEMRIDGSAPALAQNKLGIDPECRLFGVVTHTA